MANNQTVFKSGYLKLLESLQRRWQVEQGQESIEQLVKKGMEAYRFNSEISAPLLTEIEMQLKIDLARFVQSIDQPLTQASPQQVAVEDTLWSWLVAITDKSQVEWIELADDFEHNGVYQSGDIVGLGQFVCSECQQQKSIYRPQEIGHCIDCNGTTFSRAPFNP